MDTEGKCNRSWNECYSVNFFSKFLNFITNIFLTEFPKLSEKIIRKQDSPLVTGVPQVISNQNVCVLHIDPNTTYPKLEA
jgi:hypothetical protein